MVTDAVVTAEFPNTSINNIATTHLKPLTTGTFIFEIKIVVFLMFLVC